MSYRVGVEVRIGVGFIQAELTLRLGAGQQGALLRPGPRRSSGGLYPLAYLAALGLENILGEDVAGIGHGESGRAGTSLGLHHLVTAELNTLGQRLAVSLAERQASLRQERQNGDARVAADHRNVQGRRVHTLVGADESVGAAHVEGGHAADLLRVED